MNTLAVSLLLLPLIAAFALLYGPAVLALNPGNKLMTASNYTFQSDTFSAAGAIGSLAGDASDPIIITGRWNLDIENGIVSNFTAHLTMVNSSGSNYREIELHNLTSAKVLNKPNGTALVTGVLDVTINGKEKLDSVNTTITLVKLRAINITLNEPSYHLDQPIYGIADKKEEEKTATASASSNIIEGNNVFGGNITEKFRLPQLPNPFR
jgi:hypothetical protein